MASNPNIFGESFPVGSNSIPTFGVPACMLELGLEALSLLPGDALATIALSMNEGVLAARSVIADIKAEILEFLGIAQDEVDGLSFFKIDAGWAALGGAIGAVAGALSFLDEIASTAQAIGQDIEAIKDCLSDYETHLQRQRGSDAALAPTEAQLAIYQSQINSAEQFIDDAVVVLGQISEILAGRAAGTLVDPTTLTDTIEEEDEIFRLTFGPPKSTKGTFLLSVDGLYYDSQNRTYAASGNIPTLEDLPFIPDSSKWKMDHSPNLGGKGTQITLNDLDRYVDTILDVEKIDEADYLQNYYTKDHLLEVLEGQKNLVISELDAQRKDILNTYATSSAVYINMQQQIFSEIELFDTKIRRRKKQIELAVKAPDLFGVEVSFKPGEIPINDFSYLSDIHLNIALEKQRKLVLDQGDISGVVLPFKPVFAGGGSMGNNVAIAPLEVNKNIIGALASVGEYSDSTPTIAPVLTVNDPIATEGLVAVYNFLETDVEDTGSTTYNVANCTGDSRQDMQLVAKTKSAAFPKGLAIPRFSGIVKFAGDDNSFLRREEHGTYGRLPATNEMQNLLYNPSGCAFDFWLHMPNFTSGNNDFEVKVFDQGLDASSEISSLNLSQPNASWTDFNFYKAIISNENTGGPTVGDSSSVLNDFTTDHVRSLFIGFTRDPAFTESSISGLAGTLNPVENYPSLDASNTPSATYFIVAPMQSFSKDGCSFIKKDNCAPDESTYRGLSIPISNSVGGSSIADCSSSFVHMNISFDFSKDTLTVFLNGSSLATTSISSEFGTDINKPLNVPTFKKLGTSASFDYPGAIPEQESKDFLQGPKNDPFFTPWIVGGGWTDGINLTVDATKGASSKTGDLNKYGTDASEVAGTGFISDLSSVQGGFTGPSNGLQSGLGGHLGSLKIYSKPLSIGEALKNYNAHKSFFSNIEV